MTQRGVDHGAGHQMARFPFHRPEAVHSASGQKRQGCRRCLSGLGVSPVPPQAVFTFILQVLLHEELGQGREAASTQGLALLGRGSFPLLAEILGSKQKQSSLELGLSHRCLQSLHLGRTLPFSSNGDESRERPLGLGAWKWQ